MDRSVSACGGPENPRFEGGDSGGRPRNIGGLGTRAQDHRQAKDKRVTAAPGRPAQQSVRQVTVGSLPAVPGRNDQGVRPAQAVGLAAAGSIAR
jgi:hypothetical protein